LVVFAGDVEHCQLLQACREQPLLLQVHDRSALPELPAFSAVAAKQRRQQQQQQAAAAAAGSKLSSGSSGRSGSSGSSGPAAAAGRVCVLKASVVAPGAAGGCSSSCPVSSHAAAGADKAAPGQAADAVGCAGAAAKPPSPAAAAAAAAAAAGAGSKGAVFGLAAVSLLELVRGARHVLAAVPLRPVSTHSGASCLDWQSRPGRYQEVRARACVGVCRCVCCCAVVLPQRWLQCAAAHTRCVVL
jgi:hypothetical protein